jgi:hypothetical protein
VVGSADGDGGSGGGGTTYSSHRPTSTRFLLLKFMLTRLRCDRSRITQQLHLNNLLDENHFLTKLNRFLPTGAGWHGVGSAMDVTAESGSAGSPRSPSPISSPSSSRSSCVSPS